MERLSTDKLIAYLDGETTSNEADRIEALLARDPEARGQLEHLRNLTNGLTAVHQPRADEGFAARVRAGLGPTPKRKHRWLLAAVPAAACAAIAALALAPERDPFSARGRLAEDNDPARLVGVEVFLHRGSEPTLGVVARDGMVLQPGDGFSFVAHNRSTTRWQLSLVAIDARGTTHWIYPTVADGQPVVLPAQTGSLALPEGVTLTELPAGTVELRATFLSEDNHTLTRSVHLSVGQSRRP